MRSKWITTLPERSSDTMHRMEGIYQCSNSFLFGAEIGPTKSSTQHQIRQTDLRVPRDTNQGYHVTSPISYLPTSSSTLIFSGVPCISSSLSAPVSPFSSAIVGSLPRTPPWLAYIQRVFIICFKWAIRQFSTPMQNASWSYRLYYII
jgi:hypothetical protein